MKSLLNTLLLSILTSFGLNAQFSNNPRVDGADFSYAKEVIEISYNFANCKKGDKYLVWIEAYTDKNEKLETKTLLGDANEVEVGIGKKIYWDFKKDGVLLDKPFYIKLVAFKKPLVNLGKGLLYSTLLPGLGHNQVGGKNGIYMGVLGYGAIAGGHVLNSMSNNYYSKYQNETDASKSKQFYDDSKKYYSYSLMSVGVAATIWAIDYFIVSKRYGKTKNITSEELRSKPEDECLIATTTTKSVDARGLPPNLYAELSFKDDNENGILEANEKASLEIIISNRGKGEAMKLNVKLTDDNPDNSLKFNSNHIISIIKAGASYKLTIPFMTDLDLQTMEHKIKIEVLENYGYDMDPAYLKFQTFAFQPPKLAFSGFEIIESGLGTFAIEEDGQLQPGESVNLKIVVQNTGQSEAKNVNWTVNNSDQNIRLIQNSGKIDKIEPGQIKELNITLSPNKRVSTTGKLPLFLSMTEETNRGNLIDFQLPVMLNQKPPKTNIVAINSDVEALKKNVAKFEYTSKKFSSAINLIDIKSVSPSITKRPKSLGIIIGIRKYENLVPAPYADNDAKVMEEYFKNVLGIEQVLLFTNQEVTSTKMKRLFNPNYGDLSKSIVKGESEVFVYYSGHGLPDKSGENAYLFPYDGIKEDVEGTGYNTNTLYNHLSELKARKVYVFIDACFSGSSRKTATVNEENLVAQKGVIIKPKHKWLNDPNFTVFSSSTGDETSLGFDQSETGLFTYFLCAGLQGKADINNDRKITVGELQKYISDNVLETSKKISGQQTPVISGDEKIVLVEY